MNCISINGPFSGVIFREELKSWSLIALNPADALSPFQDYYTDAGKEGGAGEGTTAKKFNPEPDSFILAMTGLKKLASFVVLGIRDRGTQHKTKHDVDKKAVLSDL